jgi:hypothetical protein
MHKKMLHHQLTSSSFTQQNSLASNSKSSESFLIGVATSPLGSFFHKLRIAGRLSKGLSALGSL